MFATLVFLISSQCNVLRNMHFQFVSKMHSNIIFDGLFYDQINLGMHYAFP